MVDDRQEAIFGEYCEDHSGSPLILLPCSDLIDIADRYGVPYFVVAHYARDRQIPVEDGMMPEPRARIFGAAISYYRQNYYFETEAIRRLGKHSIDLLVAEQKIRMVLYHGLYLYRKEDVKKIAKELREKKPLSKAKQPKDQVVATSISIVSIPDGYINITSAAKMLSEKFATFYKWVVEDHLIEFRSSGRGVFVKVSDIERLKKEPFFNQARYSYKEFGRVLGNISRQTVRKWVLNGNIKSVKCPGGQSYILHDQLEIAKPLVEKAHLVTFRH